MFQKVIEAVRKRLLMVNKRASHYCAHVDHRIVRSASSVQDDFVEGLPGGLVPDVFVKHVVKSCVSDSVCVRLQRGLKTGVIW